MSSLVSTSRFSVRVAPPDAAPTAASPSKLLTTFVWRDAGAQVKLAGSFDDWRKHEMTFVPSIGYHVLIVELPPGSYEYRFVVDGRWRIVENDPNLREDQFGELSHHLVIDASVAARAPPKRFSSASVTAAHPSISEHAVVNEGQSDTSSEPDSDVEHHSHVSDEVAPPRNRDSAFIKDYDDDACGELDLQADVFEAMKDVAEVAPEVPQEASQTSVVEARVRHRFRHPGKRTLRKVWALLFGESRDQENVDPEEHHPPPVTRNQKMHGMADRASKGLKVWFPNEKKAPHPTNGRKVQPSETKDVIDVEEKALRLHQVEENANTRQMLGKTLFAQGKYDAALALFSLSVKLREDNGLKYAKTTAIAHTDVASAFIHIDDLKNAEKHLNIALSIFEKGTFSGGRAQLGDVYCFLGVIGDIKGDLHNAESCYLKAIDLYEQARATAENPNYSTAIENLNANRKRQKQAPKQMRLDMARIAEQSSRPPTSAKTQTQSPKYVQKTRTQVVQAKQQPVEYATSARSVKKEAHPRHPLEPARPPPRPPLEPARSPPRPPLEPARSPPRPVLEPARSPPRVDQNASLGGNLCHEADSPTKRQRAQNARPTTWKDLAETARQSMPQSPPDENVAAQEEEGVRPPAGSYEDLCRTWVKDARKLMGKGSYAEAIDMYTLAIYTRKRHGPWKTRENAEAVVENARALFATKKLEDSVGVLKDAIGILEELDQSKHGIFLGEVWGNLGSVLDRIGGRAEDALAAHCAEMVLYGKCGMSTEDNKWLKAWKSLCVNLKMNGATERTNEIWQQIDLQIRGVTPITKVAHVLLHS
ncbi:AMP-activated protein kinase glycogen-binding [Gracilaria domingensis]|nr:AMP-activated protein kinase glycogen-binding [Gracilaria domingensis]